MSISNVPLSRPGGWLPSVVFIITIYNYGVHMTFSANVREHSWCPRGCTYGLGWFTVVCGSGSEGSLNLDFSWKVVRCSFIQSQAFMHLCLRNTKWPVEPFVFIQKMKLFAVWLEMIRWAADDYCTYIPRTHICTLKVGNWTLSCGYTCFVYSKWKE